MLFDILWEDMLVFFIIGSTLGSFFTCLMERKRANIPNSIRVEKWSKCISCNKKLTWVEKLPIVSYLVQFGKCKQCGARIPSKYLQTELIYGLALSFATLSFHMEYPESLYRAIVLFAIYSILGLASINDILYGEAEHYFTLPVLGLALVLVKEPTSIIVAIAIYVSLLLVSYISKGGLGHADIVLMTASTFIVGSKYFPLTLLFISLTSLIAFFIQGLLSKSKDVDEVGREGLRLIPSIMIGTLLSYLLINILGESVVYILW